jgi:hypothetical protein
LTSLTRRTDAHCHFDYGLSIFFGLIHLSALVVCFFPPTGKLFLLAPAGGAAMRTAARSQ